MNKNQLIGAGVLTAALLVYINKSKTSSTSFTQHYFTGNKDFIAKLYPYARAAQNITGVPYIVSLVFAAIESGFGKHAPANNFYGIKADGSWKGEVSKLRTPECMPSADTSHLHAEILQVVPPHGSGSFTACDNRGDYTIWINDKFRAYSSPAASVLDFGMFLKHNSRYAPAFELTNDPKAMGTYILTHGYATAQYVNTFIGLMDNIQKQVNNI
jgi:flagellar protein FlgJ